MFFFSNLFTIFIIFWLSFCNLCKNTGDLLLLETAPPAVLGKVLLVFEVPVPGLVITDAALWPTSFVSGFKENFGLTTPASNDVSVATASPAPGSSLSRKDGG